MMTTTFSGVICLQCGHEMPADMTLTTCPRCGSGWLDAFYDYEPVSRAWPGAVAGRDRSLWRYGELLPIGQPDPEISLGEGFTPLVRLFQYERLFGHEQIYVKDERHMPTNSFKDRQAAMSVTAMKQNGLKECVLASTGNAGVAYAAYCARAGIKLWLFMSSLVPQEKMREVALYGAEVVKVSGTYDETKHVAAEFARRRGIVIDRGARTIPAKESMKTLAFEIAEQLGLQLNPDHPGTWIAPDWYIQAVSGGIGPLGVWKGFSELYHMGLIDRMPKLGIVQAAGCAPMVRAYELDAETAEPVVPRTLIHVLATGDPGYAYSLLREAVASNGGAMLAVEDGETFRAMRLVASRAGLSVEPATAVAFAGLEKMIQQGTIAPGEVVVVNCSGHTLPAEGHILGDQYDKYILSLDTAAESVHAPAQEEGMGAVFQSLSEQVTTIVVVDDNANDRRLIRRLLQSYKQYRVYEARDGREGLQVIRDRRPDMVVTDLTMPEMDGFTLLEHLKNDPELAAIPVVVVSAKTLTGQDRRTLETHSESVWTKGGFETRQLVEHVVSTLGHMPVGVIGGIRAEQERKAPAPETDTDPEAPLQEAPVVVVIDDNPDDIRLAQRMLRAGGGLGGGFHVIPASNGRDGLKAIYAYHPDLVLLDLILPDMDGYQIIETLQNEPTLRDIPVIIVTARTISEQERQGMQSGIRGILEKSSLDRKALLDIIKNELS
jgi:threonine synthase